MSEPFRVLLADPPWKFGDKLPGPGRGAEKHYPCLSVEELCAFAIPEMAPDAALFMWRVSSMVEEAYRVVRAWGFVPKSEIVWRKLTANGKPWFGMGRTVRAAHESCIVATRGRPEVLAKNIRSVFQAQVQEHSRKPDAFYGIVESLFDGPRVELFARRPRDGWTSIGNELEERTDSEPETLHIMLGLVMTNEPTIETVREWTPAQRLEAEAWASAEHLAASDNPVKRLPRPTFLGGGMA